MRTAFGDIQTRDRLLLRHARGPLGGLALVLLCCTVYLPGFFSIPPVDRDESRFAQASRQMFESVALPEGERDAELHGGGLAVPRVQGKERLNKPPLIYWLQAGSAAVFTGGDPLGDAIWMYRVPSLLAGIITVLATWRLGCSMFDPRAGWLAGALLAVSPVFVWEAHQARADMVMVAWTTLAMGQLWKVWRHTRGGALRAPTRHTRGGALRAPVPCCLLLWLFVTLGVLTKGPITPMVVVLTALVLAVLSRRRKESTTEGRALSPESNPGGRAFQPASPWQWLRATRPLLGLVIVIAGVAPWVYAVAQQVGFGHYWSIIADEVFGRAGSAKEGHWGPPGYHFVLLVVLFWPGSLLTGLSIARAWRRGLHGGRARESSTGRLRSRLLGWWVSFASLRATRRPEVFLLAWFLPTWIVFELVSTKLPHYTMPLYPAVALITARGICAAAGGHLRAASDVVSKFGFGIWCLILVLIVGGVVASLPGAWIFNGAAHFYRSPMLLLLAASVIAVLAGWKAARALWRQQWPAAHAAAISTVVAAYLVLFSGPIQNQLGLTQRLHDAIHDVDPDGERPIAIVEFFEDSLVFYWRGRIERIDTAAAAAWLASHPTGILIAPAESLALIEGAGDPMGIAIGSRYSKGESVTLYILQQSAE